MDRFQPANLQGARWISAGGNSKFPLFRHRFVLPKVQQARITIAALGIFEVYINGKLITEDMFLPLNTDFHKREGLKHGGYPFEEELSHRIYCPEYDVTAFLIEGNNTVCFMMGPGWYDYDDGRGDWRMAPSFGNVKLCYRLSYVDGDGISGNVCSDASLRWKTGFVKKGHLLDGESHDYRDYDDTWMNADYDDSAWYDVVLENTPQTQLFLQTAPADRICEHLTPKLVYTDRERRIYDVGKIVTGWPILFSDFPSGTKIQVRCGELLNNQDGLDEDHTYGQYTHFILDGKPRRLHCRFTWLCFRYFEVIGPAKAEDCLVIHSNVPVTAAFSCTEPVLNWLYRAFLDTQLANMHCGIPSDCPHAERRGYTGDGQLTCHTVMLQTDSKKFYEKWIYDIADCQDKKTGHVQYTAPFLPSGGGPGGWGCAIVTVPYAYYKHYGDIELIRQFYPKMLHYFEFMEAHSEDGLVVSDLPGAWCLGDWCVPAMGFNDMDAIRIPAPLVNTYFYIKAMEYVLEMSEALPITEAAPLLKKRIADKKAAIIRHYYDESTGDFAKNEQGSNAFALDLQLGDTRTFENTVRHYTQIKKYDTGIFATDVLTRILFERGQWELAVDLLTTKEDGSFFSQMENGATTLSEYWTGHRSQCHPMFGAVTRYLYEYVLGIRQTAKSIKFENIIIEPRCMSRILEADGYITTELGVISVTYNADNIQVTIPPKCRAILILGGRKVELPQGQSIYPIAREGLL